MSRTKKKPPKAHSADVRGAQLSGIPNPERCSTGRVPYWREFLDFRNGKSHCAMRDQIQTRYSVRDLGAFPSCASIAGCSTNAFIRGVFARWRSAVPDLFLVCELETLNYLQCFEVASSETYALTQSQFRLLDEKSIFGIV